ncbi:MAG TPA: ABC transporter permease [Xanthobacteraceae bacterium]|jgi:ABC-type nitrate/sulfonate/bicarbonate transport system permease component|nr:ABC transporter permease [Xanthobacteraceae bacterium]
MPAAQTTKVRAKLTARTFIWLQGLSGLIGFAALLEIVPRLGIVSPDYLPPFSTIMTALFKEMMTATFWTALSDTLEAWAIGFVISVVAGVVIGLAIGSSQLLRGLTHSTIEFLRPIPSVALIPLAVLLYGSQIQSTLVLVVYASFWPVLIQVLYGVQDVDPVARETARSYGLGAWAQIRYVTWPTTLPYLMTGIRLAAAVALILAITSEVAIDTQGLGKEITDTESGGAVAIMYAYVIVAGIIGVIVNLGARALERRVLAWHPSVRLDVAEAGA